MANEDRTRIVLESPPSNGGRHSCAFIVQEGRSQPAPLWVRGAHFAFPWVDDSAEGGDSWDWLVGPQGDAPIPTEPGLWIWEGTVHTSTAGRDHNGEWPDPIVTGEWRRASMNEAWRALMMPAYLPADVGVDDDSDGEVTP